MKKLLSILLALTLVLALGVTAFADGDGSTKLTIENSAKGGTYNIYKVFDVTYNTTTKAEAYTIETGSLWYNAVESARNLFALSDGATDNVKYVSLVEGVGTKQITDFLEANLEGKTAQTADGNGGKLTVNITGGYGYYYITTTTGTAVTLSSNTPNQTIYDKNSTTPVQNLTKTAKNGESYNIGDTITYTVSFKTANYNGAGEDAKQIVSYTITDTLPDFLKENSVIVTSITIGGSEYTVDGVTPQFDSNGEITISWIDGDGKSLYANGAEIIITYTAVLDSDAAIDGSGNTNTVEITFKDKDGGKNITEYKDSETVYTYALAIKKVDNEGKALDGAQFSLNGYQTTKNSDGVYTVTGTTTDGETDTVMDTDSEGILIIKGVKGDTKYYLTETKAPNGYNKLAEAKEVTAEKTGEETTIFNKYIDEEGNVVNTVTEVPVSYTNNDLSATTVVVVNKAGSVLPSTGGIGTTIFTVVGIVLMAGAAVLLITKKRMEGKDAK